jgi:hypothetical protein
VGICQIFSVNVRLEFWVFRAGRYCGTRLHSVWITEHKGYAVGLYDNLRVEIASLFCLHVSKKSFCCYGYIRWAGTDNRKSRSSSASIYTEASACASRRLCLFSSTTPSVRLPTVNVATYPYAHLSVIDVRADQESEGLSVEVVATVGNCSKCHPAYVP